MVATTVTPRAVCTSWGMHASNTAATCCIHAPLAVYYTVSQFYSTEFETGTELLLSCFMHHAPHVPRQAGFLMCLPFNGHRDAPGQPLGIADVQLDSASAREEQPPGPASVKLLWILYPVLPPLQQLRQSLVSP